MLYYTYLLSLYHMPGTVLDAAGENEKNRPWPYSLEAKLYY